MDTMLMSINNKPIEIYSCCGHSKNTTVPHNEEEHKRELQAMATDDIDDEELDRYD